MANIVTKNDLIRVVQSVWQHIELDYIGRLSYHSITDRLDNVNKIKGRLTKY